MPPTLAFLLWRPSSKLTGPWRGGMIMCGGTGISSLIMLCVRIFRRKILTCGGTETVWAGTGSEEEGEEGGIVSESGSSMIGIGIEIGRGNG